MRKRTISPQLLLLSLGFLTLGACSNTDSAPEIFTPEDNAIRFAVNTEYVRSGDITTNNLNTFNVYAYTGTDSVPKIFMDNVVVSKSSNNVWSYSPVQFWPAKEKVDFYAFAPAGWLNGVEPLKPIPYDAYPGTQDIIYAVAPDLNGSVGMANAQVLFNFRHALSKVTLKLSSTDTDLEVKVTNVALANIMTKGNFHFPTASTSGTPSATSTGTWTDQNTAHAYMFHMSQDANDVITLTTTATDLSNTGMGLGGPKYMLPQVLTWRSNGSGQDTYITVMCSVYDTKSGTKLWPNANTPSENVVEGSTFGDGLLKFPLSTSSFSAWEPGKHYIYNLVINSNEDMGAIEFGTPSVDTFVKVETVYN